MLYDSYERKIKKIAKVKHTIYKLRFIIAGAVILSAGSATAFNMVKGDVDEKYNIPSKMTYGDKYTPSAKALFNGAKLEYSLQNSNEWFSEKKPEDAGKYKARAYSYNGFGAKKYGPVYNFEIEQKDFEIRVKERSITYGQNLSYVSSGLLDGDKVANVSYTYEGEDYYQKSVSVNPDDFKIVNKDGLDVTKNYKTDYLKSTLNINKRKLTFSFNSDDKEYDGTLLQGTYTYSGLLDGDKLEVKEENKSILNLGSITNTIDQNNIVIKDKDNKDVTHYYDIDVLSGTLTVNKRKVTVTSSTVDRAYNGKTLTDTGDDPELYCTLTKGSLLENHYLDASFISVGLYAEVYTKNDFTVTIREKGTDKDVGEFYDLTTVKGNITITKVNITLESQSYSKAYDGEPLYGFQGNESSLITSGKLAPTDELVFDKTVSVTEPTGGVIENFLDFKIVNKTIGYLFNPNNCYYITRKYGSLEIKKIDLNVSSNSVDRVYNGLPLTSETNGELHLNYDKSKILSNLGHHVESSFIYENRFDCLHSDNRFNFKILDSGNNDITDKYYNVSRSFGYLEITPKPLKIEVFNKQKIYDGTALQVDMSDISVDGLVDTDTFILDNANSVIMPTLDNPVKELIDYRIIHSNGADVLSNYDIDFSTGYYKVDKIKIEISTNSISSSYDGRLFSDSANDETHKLKSEIEYVNSGLLEGHELRTSFINNNFYVTPDGTNVENRLDYAIYEKGTALEVENWQDIYDIKTYFGWLKVSKQNLSVSATSERVYGDGTLTLDDLNVTGLIDDIDQISFSGSIFEDPDAVATSSTFTYEITNKITGEDFSNCYNVDIDFTSFIKNPRSIVVDMPGGEIMYDGGYHSYNLSGGEPSISPTSPYSLLPNHTLSLVTRGGITSAGNYVVGNNFNSTQYGVQIYNEEDADVTFNYQIVYNYAPITIRKRNISINIDNDYLQAEFNGKSIFNNVNFNDYFSVVGDGLAPNENLGPISEGPIAPGSGTYQLQVGIYLENYSTTHNYEINVNQFNVSYSIDKIQNLIVETVGNVGKTYDGTTVVPDTNCSIEVVSPILYIDEIYDLSYSSSSPSVGTYEYDVDFTNAYFYNRSKREKIDFSDAVENVVVFNNATVEIQQRLIRFGFAKSFDTYNQDDNNVYQLPFRAEPYKYIPLVGGQNFAAGDSLELVNFTDVELSYIGDTATLGYSVDNIIIRNKNQEDVTDCYEIITENRLFEVIPGTVYINSLSNYQTYNRRDITYEEYEIVSGFVQYEAEVEIDWSFEAGTRTNVGTYDNEFDVISITLINSQGERIDVTNSYEVEKIYGYLSVEPLVVYYSCHTILKEYNGREVVFRNEQVTNTSFTTAGISISEDLYYTLYNMGFIIAVSYTDSNYVTVGEYNTTPVFTIFDTTNNNQEVEQGNIVIVPISENNANPMVIINTRSITLTNSRSGKPLTFYGTYEDDKYKTDSPISFSLATANGSSSLGSGDKIVGDINAILEGVTKVEQILLDNGEAIRVVTYRAELLNEAFNQALADGRIKIYNKNNQDVTYCYNIEFNLTDINIYYFVIE